MRIKILCITVCILMSFVSCGRSMPQEIVDTSEESSEEAYVPAETAADSTDAGEDSAETESTETQIPLGNINFCDGMEDNSVDFHMTAVSKWILENEYGLDFDIYSSQIITSDNVEVRGLPNNAAKVNQLLFGQMVKVCAVVTWAGDDNFWVLIEFNPFDAMYDNIGWVKLSDLMEYKEETKHLLRYPVTLKEGTVSLETGEVTRMNGSSVSVHYIDDAAYISAEGGWSDTVSPDSIIYPPFEKETDID